MEITIFLVVAFGLIIAGFMYPDKKNKKDAGAMTIGNLIGFIVIFGFFASILIFILRFVSPF